MTAPRLAIGCMTGTSLDALDAALVEAEGHGLSVRVKLVRACSLPLGGLGPALRRLAEQEPMPAGVITALASGLADLHAQAVRELAPPRPPDLVCVHGQTVFHAPPHSWQLMNAPRLARLAGAPVVFDLRGADLAAGGAGAPITPIADWVLFRHAAPRVAVVNLGGFCNFTRLRRGSSDTPAPGAIGGGDVCACNQLLDHVARAALGRPYDEGGAAALRGVPEAQARDALVLALREQAGARRSLGTGDELGGWVRTHAARLAPDDLAATAADALARVISGAVADADEVLVAGGGTRHGALLRGIARHADRPVSLTSRLGVPPEYREAVGFAVLGLLCADRVPITLPEITGVRAPAPVAGCWAYP